MTLIRRAVLLALAIGVVPAAPLAAQGAAAAQKFAYVNSQEILSRAPGRAAAEKAFNDEREGVLKIVQRMQDSLQTMVQAYQRDEAKLDSATKATRQTAIRTRNEEYSRRTQQYEEQIANRQRELVAPMMEQVREVLEQIRQEGGYTFIFDVGADGGSIVAADKNLDITARVVSRLKPIPVTAAGSGAPRPDSSRGAGPRPAPSGLTRPPTKSPTQ